MESYPCDVDTMMILLCIYATTYNNNITSLSGRKRPGRIKCGTVITSPGSVVNENRKCSSWRNVSTKEWMGYKEWNQVVRLGLWVNFDEARKILGRLLFRCQWVNLNSSLRCSPTFTPVELNVFIQTIWLSAHSKGSRVWLLIATYKPTDISMEKAGQWFKDSTTP